jgi:Leucine-rich repeat (LRR) protein
VLTLSDNLLEHLPTKMGNFRALTQLAVSNNQLKELPTTIGNLPAIAQLWLDHNALETLPPSIGLVSPPLPTPPRLPFLSISVVTLAPPDDVHPDSCIALRPGTVRLEAHAPA